jgi:hypothetical protein
VHDEGMDRQSGDGVQKGVHAHTVGCRGDQHRD